MEEAANTQIKRWTTRFGNCNRVKVRFGCQDKGKIQISAECQKQTLIILHCSAMALQRQALSSRQKRPLCHCWG